MIDTVKRRLPIGIQDFVSIREGNFVYIDKTAQIHELASGSGKTFFLSRPRRFGKSLLCSTLGAFFTGRRNLFTGLAVDSLEWDWKKYPVIHIDLNAGVYSEGVEALRTQIGTELQREARKLGVSLDAADIISQFKRLIEAASAGYGNKAVVIVDEYDKPLLNTIELSEIHQKIRNELKGFYGVLKSYDAYLQFVFLTGVTKFAQVSVFSDLNQIADISFDPRYAALCGITQEELERDFQSEIDGIIQNIGKGKGEYFEQLRRFYNGYRFSINPLTVYNPFGLLNHFEQSGKFLSYWYASGTPAFLINLIKKQYIDINHLENNRVGYDSFHKYDTETMEAVPLLYQTGYLTIVEYDEERNQLVLDYPNEEVRFSFAQSLVQQYLDVAGENLNSFIVRFTNAVYDGDVDGMMNTFKPFFASINYDLIKEQENYYQTVIHLVFTMLGLQCRSEVRTAAGRIDTLVETKKNVYCFEFKIRGSAETALKQIDSKEYLLPWTGSGKRLFKVGVSFNRKKRNIGAWKVKEVE